MSTNIYQFENISMFYTLSSVPPVQETLQVSPSHVCTLIELHSPLHIRLPEQDNVQTFLLTPPADSTLTDSKSSESDKKRKIQKGHFYAFLENFF